MVDEGADIIDIGGESTRPGGAPVSESVEIERVIPIIKTLKERVNLPLSLDTSKAAVGLKGLEAGVVITSYSIHYTKLYDGSQWGSLNARN